MENGNPPPENGEPAESKYTKQNREFVAILDRHMAKQQGSSGVNQNGDGVAMQNGEDGEPAASQAQPESESEDDEPLLDGPQFAIPGDFSLDPPQKFIFRGPFDTKQAKTLKIYNNSIFKIAFRIEVFSQGRIELSNTIGQIQPGEFARVEVRTLAFKSVPRQKDRIQVDVMNAPEGKLLGSWFWRDGTRTRRSVTVKYEK